MRRASVTLAAVAALACASPASAAPALVPVASGLDAPVYVTAPPGDAERLFVVELGGLVKVVHDGVLQPEPFIDLRPGLSTGGERGLLSMAFPPGYATSGLAYTYRTGEDGRLEIHEHRRAAGNANRTEPGARLVWFQEHSAFDNHNGGQIEFGPDGLLWLAPGDGGGNLAPNAQDLGTQLGKLLRIDPRPSATQGYTVPPDNPYVGQAGRSPEIWAAGLRNPYRFSFDRGTGDLLIGDVGGGLREEINHVRRVDGLARGMNFGWPCFEGRTTNTGCTPVSHHVPPVYDYSQPSPKAVTGGRVVRDPGLPTLAGRYVFADFYEGAIKSFDLAAPDATLRAEGLTRSQVAAFGEDACGRIYVVSLRGGTVDRIQDGAPSACPALLPPPPPPPPPSPAADTRRPTIGVTVAGRRSALVRRRLRVAVRSDETVAVTAAGRLRGVARLRGARAQVPAGGRRVLTVRLSRATARKLRRALRRRGRVTAAVTVRARDAAGNEATATRRVTIRRR